MSTSSFSVGGREDDTSARYITMGQHSDYHGSSTKSLNWKDWILNNKRVMLILFASLCIMVLGIIMIVVALNTPKETLMAPGSIASSSSSSSSASLSSSSSASMMTMMTANTMGPTSGAIVRSSSSVGPSMTSATSAPIMSTAAPAAAVTSSSSSSADYHPACGDLYAWACADWLGKTDLGNRSSFSRFSEIGVYNNAVLDQILEQGNSGFPILDNFMASCMNVAAINDSGISPILPYIKTLNSVTTWPQFMNLMGQWKNAFSFNMIVSPAVGAGTNVSQTILTLTQQTLLMNNANYANATLRANLVNSIVKMFMAAGDDSTTATFFAQQVVDLETMLVGILDATGNAGSANRTRSYTNMTSLLSAYPMVLADYFQGAKIILVDTTDLFHVTVASHNFFTAVNAIMMATPGPSTAWTNYARYRLLTASAPYLNQAVFTAYTAEHFPVDTDIYSPIEVISRLPVEEEKMPLLAVDPRFTTCRSLVNQATVASDLLGNAFMAQKFPAAAWQIVEDMVTDIRTAWTAWIPNLIWLDDAGQMAFQQKMLNMRAYIGGPPLLASYANLTLDPTQYFTNVITLKQLHGEDTWRLLLAAYDPIVQWRGAAASTVNAFYTSNLNAFYLYAGFFQSPLFFYGDYAANAPWVGEVIGHEMGHGFDASGILRNQTGYRVDWLTPSVMTDFNRRTQCTKDSYSKLSWNGIYINGNTTITENMADIIGIRVAYLAYKKWLLTQGSTVVIPADYLPKVTTGDQYFMAHWAQTECVLQTPAALRTQILSDVHAPGFARINGAAQVFSAMGQAFNCPVGSPMRPVDACFIY